MCGSIVFVQCSSEITFLEAILEGDSAPNSLNLEVCLFFFVSAVVVVFVEFRECDDLQLQVLCEEWLDSSVSDSGVTWVKPCVDSSPNKSLQCAKKTFKTRRNKT